MLAGLRKLSALLGAVVKVKTDASVISKKSTKTTDVCGDRLVLGSAQKISDSKDGALERMT